MRAAALALALGFARNAAADPVVDPVVAPAAVAPVAPVASVADPVMPKQLGVDATLGVPLSPWRETVGTGGGGSIWVHVPISPLVDVTARLGAIVHAARAVADDPAATARLSEIPLLGGARYRVTDGLVRGYLEGEVGLVFARVDAGVQGVTDDSAEIRLGCSLGAALEIDRFDLRADVWFADLSDRDHAIGLTFSVGGRAWTF